MGLRALAELVMILQIASSYVVLGSHDSDHFRRIVRVDFCRRGLGNMRRRFRVGQQIISQVSGRNSRVRGRVVSAPATGGTGNARRAALATLRGAALARAVMLLLLLARTSASFAGDVFEQIQAVLGIRFHSGVGTSFTSGVFHFLFTLARMP